jgi:GNAT superfamily N-acetyltransferase
MHTAANICIVSAVFPEDAGSVRKLFSEYVQNLGVDLAFQGFDTELAQLPGKYIPPSGDILLARNHAGDALACVALRATTVRDMGEIKRLYVRPAARGQGLGRRMVEVIVGRARELGYANVVLDTLVGMDAARRLYAEFGFHPIPPYYENPLPGTSYMALELRPASG